MTTTFTTQTKSQLAKLLATENIRVEHRKLSTAAFDVKNRVLYCPIWKDMSGDLYDLLMGHEVGHALYTPEEGWHDAVCANGKNFKAFLNVIEDARIEKKVKRKYPGLRPSFIRAYQTLIDQDFFNIKGHNINDLPFIDRLNLYTKSDYTMDIEFSAKEKDLIDRVRACESWNDVLKITGEVWDYSKEEQKQEQFEFKYDSQSGFGDEDTEDFDYDSDGDSTEVDEGEDAQSKAKSKSSDEGEESDDVEEDGDKQINRFKDSKPAEDIEDYNDPVCETDQSFRSREGELLDETSKDYRYLTFPKPILSKIVTPAKRVHELIDAHNKNKDTIHYREDREAVLDEKVKDFKKQNEKYISLLVKEFEMKKAASRFAKAKVANTGDIDVSRLYKYQVDDNIFRKAMIVPNGKSHGLVLLLDRSGSMNNNMRGSIEQILVLAMFCRKVNIPFVVYGFGDQTVGRKEDFPQEYTSVSPRYTFTRNFNELDFDTVYLREYMNSKMSNAEFSKVLRNMVQLMWSYGPHREFSVPLSETLSNTPMSQAFVALAELTQEFRKVNNLDIVNTVVIHDGDADFLRMYFNQEGKPNYMSCRNENVYIVDKKLKKEYKINKEEDMQRVVMQWYSDKTGSKIFGFFVSTATRSSYQYMIRDHFVDEKGFAFNNYKNTQEMYAEKEKLSKMAKEFAKEKFLISHKKGYSKFFLIAGGNDLTIQDDGFDPVINGKVTSSKLANAFLKYNQKRQVSRVLVSKFIEGIAV